jgi:hypothetical protein
VDPNDPFGLNYVFVHNDDCDLSWRYLRELFTEEPIAAVLNNCKHDYCPAFYSWVHTVKHFLDTSTVTGKKAIQTPNTYHTVNGQTTGDHTRDSKPSDATPKFGVDIQNTHQSPTRTPAPGSPAPTKTPIVTRKTEHNHKPAPTRKPPHDGHGSIVNTRKGPSNTKTKHQPSNDDHDDHATGKTRNTKPNETHDPHDETKAPHGSDRDQNSITKTRKPNPQNTLSPTAGRESEPVVRIGTETLTQNSDSKYVLSGKTLTPGLTTILGSGPSATTVAISTQGKATYVIINDETSKLGAGPRTTDASEFLVGSKTLPPGSSVVISRDTYSLASDGSTIFVNGHPEEITLKDGKTVATLSNGMVITETEAPGAVSSSVTGLAHAGAPDRATTVLKTVPELLLGSKTLLPGTQVVVSGTTYSLGAGASQIYINGKPTRISLSDGTSVVTLPDGMIVTETEATTALTLTTSLGGVSGASTSVAPASMGIRVGPSFSFILMGALSLFILGL